MWKNIVGFEGLYQVSDDAEIKSLSRQIISKTGQTYTLKERILKPTTNPRGYLQVFLRKDRKTYALYVHRIVAEAFVPNPDNLPTVNHKDGVKANCKAYNLEWSTYGENNQHAYDNNLHGRGEMHYRSHLTEDQVREIRKHGKNATYEEIAQKYNVTKATIRDVILFRTWKHIT